MSALPISQIVGNGPAQSWSCQPLNSYMSTQCWSAELGSPEPQSVNRTSSPESKTHGMRLFNFLMLCYLKKMYSIIEYAMLVGWNELTRTLVCNKTSL